MKEYYSVIYNDYGYGEIFKKYNLIYKGFKIDARCVGDENLVGKIILEKYKLFSNRVSKWISIPIIIEYDTNTKRYYDIITGEEYVETVEKVSDQYLVNKGGNLELYFNKYGNELSVNTVSESLRKLTPFEIEAYTIAMSNLKKAANERVRIINNERKNSENYIESFKRNRRK